MWGGGGEFRHWLDSKGMVKGQGEMKGRIDLSSLYLNCVADNYIIMTYFNCFSANFFKLQSLKIFVRISHFCKMRTTYYNSRLFSSRNSARNP
jgi:hypothetical protein